MTSFKPYQLSVAKREGYLFARVEATSKESVDVREYLTEIVEECLRLRCTNILIENETPGPFQFWTSVALTPKLIQYGTPVMKIAIVEAVHETPEQRQHNVVIGQTQQLNVRVFDDIPEAEGWLAPNVH